MAEVFVADGLKESAHGEFRCRIAGAPGQSDEAGHRADAHYAAFGAQDVWQRVACAVDRAPEVDVHQPVQHAQFHLLEVGAHRQAGVVDQDVDAAEAFDGGFDQMAAVVFAADVGADHKALMPFGLQLRSYLVEPLAAARRQHHPRALLCKCFDARQAYPRRRSCNYHYFVSHHFCLVFGTPQKYFFYC